LFDDSLLLSLSLSIYGLGLRRLILLPFACVFDGLVLSITVSFPCDAWLPMTGFRSSRPLVAVRGSLSPLLCAVAVAGARYCLVMNDE
jgi:hypothetical protein